MKAGCALADVGRDQTREQIAQDRASLVKACNEHVSELQHLRSYST
jgi:hypothetical protein